MSPSHLRDPTGGGRPGVASTVSIRHGACAVRPACRASAGELQRPLPTGRQGGLQGHLGSRGQRRGFTCLLCAPKESGVPESHTHPSGSHEAPAAGSSMATPAPRHLRERLPRRARLSRVRLPRRGQLALRGSKCVARPWVHTAQSAAPELLGSAFVPAVRGLSYDSGGTVDSQAWASCHARVPAQCSPEGAALRHARAPWPSVPVLRGDSCHWLCRRSWAAVWSTGLGAAAACPLHPLQRSTLPSRLAQHPHGGTAPIPPPRLAARVCCGVFFRGSLSSP